MTADQFAARAWSMRCEVEHHAQRRFGRLGQQIARLDPGSPLVALLGEASNEEAKHARLCGDLATSLGAEPNAPPPTTPRVAPADLGERDAVLYEMVASCCIAETESMATLTLLLSKMSRGRFRDVVHAITRDEVEHAKAGWAHLSREAARRDLGFLGPHLVTMLHSPAVREVFAPCAAEVGESEELYAFGVVPHAKKRELFVTALEQLVLPGLDGAGVDTQPLRAWLQNIS